MLKVNEYFDGKVMSIALENSDGNSTVGVMVPGDYEFGTSNIEYMFVVSGSLTVLLPGKTEWETYNKGETFVVEANTKFKVQVKEQTAYLCTYK